VMTEIEAELKEWLKDLTEEERSKYLLLTVMKTMFGAGDSLLVMSPEGIRQFAEDLRGERPPEQDPYPTVRELIAAREAVWEGRFDPDNRAHRYANFIALLQQLENSTMRREIPWEEYLAIVERGKAGKASTRKLARNRGLKCAGSFTRRC